MLLAPLERGCRALAEEIPSVPEIDAPELARLGPYGVGYRTLTLEQPGQVDVLATDPLTGKAPRVTRRLIVDLWYPARSSSPASAPSETAAPRIRYQGEMPSEPPRAPARFSVPGIAMADAPPAPLSGAPLVIVSHGYSNVTAALSWVTENLASKGYVVAAIRHQDPPIGDAAKVVGLLLRRPLDIAFVAAELARRGRSSDPVLSRTDAQRVALLGYSMGGYGVLTAAGAQLSPGSAPVRAVPGGALAPYAAGGAHARDVLVENLRAVVAISPYGGAAASAAWGAEGLARLRVPMLLIVGDHDERVGFEGVRTIFQQAIHAPRYLLVFENAAHSIGLDPAPAAMREQLWDFDWFEDPVWRARRVNAVNLHFITAFLDRFVKNEADRANYLDVAPAIAAEGKWPEHVSGGYAAYSPGGDGLTWRGFQRRHVAGLELHRAAALP
ncbi:MAG TPA: hypothetical protein VME21_02440 [Steroidobacteraceae bacterium]|nr:hypothetical protein [Steroidobacteraceae bacterium]